MLSTPSQKRRVDQKTTTNQITTNTLISYPSHYNNYYHYPFILLCLSFAYTALYILFLQINSDQNKLDPTVQ